jgi:hypothetical protein
MGAIRTKEYAADSDAIDDDWLLETETAFRLISVELADCGSPSDSENFVIKSISPTLTKTVTQYSFDLSSDPQTSYVFRFDKDFAAGTTIGLDYANTGTDPIIRIITYEDYGTK